MSVGENKAIARRFIEEDVINPDALDETMATDCVLRGWQSDGLDTFKKELDIELTGLPDIHLSVDGIVAEEDRVLVEWTGTATHTGEYRGFAPTNKQIKWKGVTSLRITDDKIVEYSHITNVYWILLQLGLVPTWEELVEQAKSK